MFKDIHRKIRFFSNKDEVFFAYFAPNLQPLHVKAGELIYQKGEHPHSSLKIKKYIFNHSIFVFLNEIVYFILKGRANIITGFQKINFKTLVQGSYFGELEVLSGCSRNFSVMAGESCNLLTISKGVNINNSINFS